jgi:hypothetical protein
MNYLQKKHIKYGTANMDNRDDRNKISNEVKPQDPPCTSTNYEQNEEVRNFQRSSATDEEQKGDSTVR